METIDLAIAILAVLAIVGSVVGLATYEGGNVNTYEVTFEKHEAEDPVTDDATIEGSGSAELTLEVTQHNITDADVTTDVSTSDAVLSGYDVEVEVTPPDLDAKDGSGSIGQDVSGGSTTVDVAYEGVSELPEDHDEQATSPSALRQQAAEDHSHALGTGNWTVTVTTSGGATGGQASFDVDVEIALTYFDVHAQRKTPDVQR